MIWKRERKKGTRLDAEKKNASELRINVIGKEICLSFSHWKIYNYYYISLVGISGQGYVLSELRP